MIDIKNIFDNTSLSYMNKDNNLIKDKNIFKSFYPNFKRYFGTISTKSNEKVPESKEWSDFVSKLNNKENLIHIFFWNLLTKIENFGLKNIPFKKVKKKKKEGFDNKIENIENVNKRLKEYSNEEYELLEKTKEVLKGIFWAFLIIIFIIFVVKGQFSNLKILFYILLLFVINYTSDPIYLLIKENTYHLNRIFQLGILYLVMILTFVLFISFKYFVFNEEDGSSEGKTDMYILFGIIGFSGILMLSNYLYYNKGFKKFI
jgi:hypothetical protein